MGPKAFFLVLWRSGVFAITYGMARHSLGWDVGYRDVVLEPVKTTFLDVVEMLEETMREILDNK